MTDDFKAILDYVVEMTGHTRLKELVGSDPERYRPVVYKVAAGLGPRPDNGFREAIEAIGSDRSRVRAGFVGPHLWAGGAEAHGASVIRNTIDRIQWVGAVGLDGNVGGVTETEYDPLCPTAYGMANARALASQCDVVVTWAVANTDRFLLGLTERPKLVAVVHSTPDTEWGRKVYSETTGVDVWVLVSESCRGALPQRHRESARLIPNAPDPARLIARVDRETQRSLWGIRPGTVVAGLLQRVTAEKGCGAALALAKACPETIDVVVVGDGRDLPFWRGEAETMGLQNLKFVGPTHDPGSALAAFDTLIVPSDYESFCLTIAEGWLAGVPVISTPVGIAEAHPELVRTVGFGRTPLELGEALASDLGDKEGTAARVRLAKVFVEKAYPIEGFGKAWGDLLLSIAAPSVKAHLVRSGTATESDKRATLDAVIACPHRGRELSNSEMARLVPGSCSGCGGPKARHECDAGRGSIGGYPTLDDCLLCVSR